VVSFLQVFRPVVCTFSHVCAVDDSNEAFFKGILTVLETYLGCPYAGNVKRQIGTLLCPQVYELKALWVVDGKANQFKTCSRY
jgi:hypothetical protein